MSYNANVYNVMIASPGDVVKERQCIREVIYEWNAVHSQLKGIVLLPLCWESHSSPEMGRHPQEIINRQVLEKSDILVGVFWTRVGTPTDKYVSGSVEEIEKHIESGKPTMLYFSNKDIPQKDIDHNQLAELNKFRESCKPRGLFSEFSDVANLKELLRNHLQIKTNNIAGYKAEVDNMSASSHSLEYTPIIRKSQPDSLSYEEMIMLKAVSIDDNSHVIKINGLGINGHTIAIRSATISINFTKSNTQRESSKWSGCLDSMVVKGLMQASDKGERYTLTDKGYDLADQIERKLLDEFLEKEGRTV